MLSHKLAVCINISMCLNVLNGRVQDSDVVCVYVFVFLLSVG